jgi:hypothetical protein
MSIYRVDSRVIDFRGVRSWTVGTPPGGGGGPVGGQTLDVYAHFNSLHNHGSGEWTPSTKVGNWVKRMADAAPGGGNIYTLGAQFGFYPGWTLPPFGSNAHEEVTTPHLDQWVGSWTGAQNIEVVEFVPDNFDSQYFDPATQSNFGVIQTAFISLIDSWESNAPNASRRYAIYAGWPDLNRYGGSNADPATVPAQGYQDWISYGLGAYQTWMELLVSRLQAARPLLDVRLHNVNKAVLMAYRDTAISSIPVTTLFEDLAPHGRATWYFLAAVAEYIELYNEKPSAEFAFNPAWGVHSTVVSNYQSIVDYIWGVLRP